MALSCVIAGCAAPHAGRATSASVSSPTPNGAPPSGVAPPTSSGPAPKPSCSPAGSSGPAMAYVTYHLIGLQFHYYVAAISLPSARIRWTVEIPDALPIDAMAVAPGG